MVKKEITSSQKAFFFLRHNNDIDHTVPVLYKWLKTENITTYVIIPTSRELVKDERIQMLNKYKNANICYLGDFFKKRTLKLFCKYYFKYDTQADNFIKKSNFAKKFADKRIKIIANKIFKDTKQGIVVFDWTATYFTKKIVEIAKQKKFTTISLPHGDRVYVSVMERKEHINYEHMDEYKVGEIFDYFVVPNKTCAGRHDKFFDSKKLKVLGSARYSDEWLKISSNMIKPYNVDNDKGKLKVVMFLRNLGFPINWEEVAISIKLISQFNDVYLIVKNHPRSANSKYLEEILEELYPDIEENYDKNLKFLYGGVNSVALMKWADIIIDLGTSIVWEAVKDKKPVLMPEYLNANYSYIADFMPETEIKCRDQLYDTIESFAKNKKHKFYKEEGRQRFIREIIDVPDKKILERYVKFLKSCLDESGKK